MFDNDPDFIPQDVAEPQRSLYAQNLDRCLGQPGAAARFLHIDNFPPAPRSTGPAGLSGISPAVRRRLATDAAFAKQQPELVAFLARESRADFFARLRRGLGKPVAALPVGARPGKG